MQIVDTSPFQQLCDIFDERTDNGTDMRREIPKSGADFELVTWLVIPAG